MFSQINDRKHIKQNFPSVAGVMPQGGTWGAEGFKNFSVGICDGAPSTVRSSFSCDDQSTCYISDPNEMPFDLLKQALFMYQDPSKIPAFLQDAQKKVAAADGFIFVSAEYYNSIPPALSSMVDHFAPWDYLFKPSAIITYSSGKSETIIV